MSEFGRAGISRQSDAPVSPQELARACAALGFALPDATAAHLAAYLEELMRWNRAVNLVGARTWREALDNLIVDSLHLARFLPALPLPDAPLCWDPGAGAGLPGIPLRLLWPRGRYWMIEAREKRALFLSNMLARIPLPGVRVYRGRLEEFFVRCPDGAAPADLVLSRAFLPRRELLALLRDKVGADGIVVLMLNAAPPADVRADPAGDGRWRALAEYPYAAGAATRVLFAVARSG